MIVRVIVDGVLGVIVDVHIGHDEVLVIHVAIFVVIFCNWRCARADTRHTSHKKIDVMKDIDSVPSNVQSARQEALLYVFQDNEAVIKMIMKGRSPTMRYVSRTHRVALD